MKLSTDRLRQKPRDVRSRTGDIRAHSTSVPGILNCEIRTWPRTYKENRKEIKRDKTSACFLSLSQGHHLPGAYENMEGTVRVGGSWGGPESRRRGLNAEAV